ncbi:hypothetical protein BESB_019160 [Besnoitia besnoiti]|uniref:Uncharacterized protein n=1 Tax=Besnoitia besnoiti TaxID=94643 RepID=A0A2A9M1W2_BESBE|nr:hypothetical protein BESB_019160 [Besnoitia besnoiti]PFH31975.1 hypothetical protein BESB_019160 [Besnoitia besnoiti]
MSTLRRGASRTGMPPPTSVFTQFRRGSPDGRYAHPRRMQKTVTATSADDNFGWTEQSLFDVFLVLTKVHVTSEELEYRDRQHGVADPPPSTIVPQPRPKLPVVWPLPKATAPPHPSKINVDNTGPRRPIEEDGLDPTDRSVSSSLPSSARRGRTGEPGDGSRRGGSKHSDRSDRSLRSDHTDASNKNKDGSKAGRSQKGNGGTDKLGDNKGDQSHRSDVSDKTDKSEHVAKKDEADMRKTADSADKTKDAEKKNPIGSPDAQGRPKVPRAKERDGAAGHKRSKPQKYKVSCKVGRSKAQNIPLKNNGDAEKTFSVSVSDPAAATAKSPLVTVPPGEEVKVPVKVLPAEAPGGKTVTVTFSDGSGDTRQAQLDITYVMAEAE